MIERTKLISAGCASIALAGAGAGIGIVFGSFMTAFSRNPFLTKILFCYAILGFALTEAIALFAFMMAFLILFLLVERVIKNNHFVLKGLRLSQLFIDPMTGSFMVLLEMLFPETLEIRCFFAGGFSTS